MSSPVVYLGPPCSGKELFYYLSLQNNYKTIVIRSDVQVNVGTPKSKTEYHLKRYFVDNSNELYVRERLVSIDSCRQCKPEDLIKEPNNVKRFKNSQILKIISENTDTCFFVFGINAIQVFPIMMAPHFRKCRIVIPYRKHRFEKQLVHYLNESYQFAYTQSLGQSCDKSCEYLDTYLDHYELYVKTLNDLCLPYEFVDMSDPDMYNKLGINSDHIEFDYENHRFTSTDPGWEKLAETSDEIKLSLVYVNNFIDTRRDRITSLFPDIVL